MTSHFVRVALPRPVEELFHYRIPPGLADEVVRGSIVHVPFGKRIMTGVVVDLTSSSPVPARSIVGLAELPPLPRKLVDLALWAAAYYQCPAGLLLRLALPPSGGRGKGPRFVLTGPGREALALQTHPDAEILAALGKGPRTSGFLTERFSSQQLESLVAQGLAAPAAPSVPGPSPQRWAYQRTEEAVRQLNTHQEKALTSILSAVDRQRFGVTLLKGVTGSGKTEVYLRAAAHTLGKGGRVLFLVPEISLTPLLISRLQGVAEGEIAALHSGMTRAERTGSWEAVMRGWARLIVGVRSGVFAPVPELGLIIVDEEHDPSFRQEDTPSYNARDVAVKRGQLEGVPVVLGSATPSFESWHNAREGRYNLVLLPDRAASSPEPKVLIVDMSQPDAAHPGHPALSKVLIRELSGVVDRDEQAMLFLNRRGIAPFFLCSACRHMAQCPNCSVTLTFHSNRLAVCHYCGYRQAPPERCPACQSPGIEPVGVGTQGVERALKELFPDAAVDRMDRDALLKKGALEEIYKRMDSGETKILVGTQMLAKGHDFPGVTLAGILSAEQALDLPDFRSAERTFQIITQVSGRAGRGERPGKVVIQTFAPEHYAVTSSLSGDQEAFYDTEISTRQALGYPPFGRMGRIVLDGVRESKVSAAAHAVSGGLPVRQGTRILGPSPAPLSRIRSRYRWHILVLAPSHTELMRVLQAARGMNPPGVRVTVRVDPVQLM